MHDGKSGLRFNFWWFLVLLIGGPMFHNLNARLLVYTAVWGNKLW